MRNALLRLALLLTGCAPSPESYPIPPQHQGDLPKQEIFSFGEYVKSSQPDAEAYFLRDIMGAGGWRPGAGRMRRQSCASCSKASNNRPF